MPTRISDLPKKLVGEKILTRVPITSLKAVRSTCKEWNALTKNRVVLGKATAAAHQFLTMNSKVYSLRFEEGFGDVSLKQVDLLNELKVSKLYHCDGLVLCVAKDNSKLVLWNPYLCQTRCIEPRERFNLADRYAIGYSDSGNHKILRCVKDYSLMVCEIYDIRSNSWRVFEVLKPEWSIDASQRGVSVKGNTYFFANYCVETFHAPIGLMLNEIKACLVCFDFAKERFGPRLSFPFEDSFDGFNGDVVALSSFRDDEQLAVLSGGYESGFFEIWVSLTVDPDCVTWSKFLRVETGPLSYGFQLYSSSNGGSFFLDEENKVAVLFEIDGTNTAHTAFVFGQDGYFKSSFNLGEALILEHRSLILTNELFKAAFPPLVSSFRPSLVQLKQQQPSLVRKRKRMSRLHKWKRISLPAQISSVKLRRMLI